MCNNMNKTNFWSFEEDVPKLFIIVIGLVFALILGGISVSAIYYAYLASTGLQQCQALGTGEIVWQRDCVIKSIGEEK